MLNQPNIPNEWKRIEAVESHAAGEPLRVITKGLPELEGKTILERRRHMQNKYDDFRSMLMGEPRGHTNMYGAILTNSVSDESDIGVLFMTNNGYSSMCGHGIIALGTVLQEAEILPLSPPESIIRFDTPAGPVTAICEFNGNRVSSVAFENVPSFAPLLNETVNVPEFGSVEFDLGYGGAFYAYCDTDQVGVEISPSNAAEIRHAGMAIKQAVSNSFEIDHPFEEDLSFLYGTVFREESTAEGYDSKNVCVFADGQIDRSPTGTGVSGRLAIQAKRGNLKKGDEFAVESIINTVFRGTVSKRIKYGNYDAIIPRISGSAYITGRSEFIRDPNDSLRNGFFVR